MLIYHPAYDLNHGMFRLLRLLSLNPEGGFEWDTYRILDFYYLFPPLLSGVRLPAALTKRKKEFGRAASAYNRVPSPKVFIQQMRGIHESVARSLVAKGFLEAFAGPDRRLVRSGRELPPSLLRRFQEATADEELVRMLAIDLAALPLTGPNGLKARTRLLEYRYDAV